MGLTSLFSPRPTPSPFAPKSGAGIGEANGGSSGGDSGGGVGQGDDDGVGRGGTAVGVALVIDADKRTVRHFFATNEDDNGFGGVRDGRKPSRRSSNRRSSKCKRLRPRRWRRRQRSHRLPPRPRSRRTAKGAAISRARWRSRESSKSSPIKGFGMAGNNSVGVALDVKTGDVFFVANPRRLGRRKVPLVKAHCRSGHKLTPYVTAGGSCDLCSEPLRARHQSALLPPLQLLALPRLPHLSPPHQGQESGRARGEAAAAAPESGRRRKKRGRGGGKAPPWTKVVKQQRRRQE